MYLETVETLVSSHRSKIKHEIIIVDDGSTDGDLAKIENLTGATLIKHTNNRGYGASKLDYPVRNMKIFV